MTSKANVDNAVIAGFGAEWRRFDQSGSSAEEQAMLFHSYFSIFPWNALPAEAVGFDLGCGTGRWARFVAARVGRLHCIDASEEALGVAQSNLAGITNCRFHHASVDRIPLEDEAADFGYCLGVLHHVPDTQAGIAHCAAKLKHGAPFLIYLYYRLDGRPWWYQGIWRLSDGARRLISLFPTPLKNATADALAAAVYLPLARIAGLLRRAGIRCDWLPLSYYRDKSVYIMRNDALDRLGTRVEKRFSRADIEDMLRRAGLTDISFSPYPPFWCVIGYKDSKRSFLEQEDPVMSTTSEACPRDWQPIAGSPRSYS